MYISFLDVGHNFNAMSLKILSDLTGTFLPSKSKVEQESSESLSMHREGIIAHQDVVMTANAFNRTQSYPVTRSEHANVPPHQLSSLKSILRSSRIRTNVNIQSGKIKSTGAIGVSTNTLNLMEIPSSDSEDEDAGFGRLLSIGRSKGGFSPPPFSRAKTAPACVIAPSPSGGVVEAASQDQQHLAMVAD